MILNGLRPTRIQRNGLKPLKLTVFILVLTLFFSACSAHWLVGDGRGDWTLDLYKGYAISKINSYEILFVHKMNPDDSGGSIILPNYFVTAYQLHEPYICLEGIPTQEIGATVEELNDRVLSYYLVDTSTGEVIGPFEFYDEFAEHCGSLKIEIANGWIKIDK